MDLSRTVFPQQIRTGKENPAKDLFEPLLENSVEFNVAVGYFSSNWLRETARGFGSFWKNSGKSNWVISPYLSQEDAEIIANDSSITNKAFERIETTIIDQVRQLEEQPKATLCKLISEGVIEFKIALPKEPNSGMFHAKIGYGKDSSGNIVAYSGSYNHTASANSNWERIDVFRSYEISEKGRVDSLVGDFDDLWNGADIGYGVYTPSKSLLKKIKHEYDHIPNGSKPVWLKEKECPRDKLRNYQKLAIDDWINSEGRGSFVMATGTGKTFTALGAMSKLRERVVMKRKNSLVIICVVPLRHLLVQWSEEAKLFSFDAIRCFESKDKWYETARDSISNLNFNSECELLLVTNSTFISKSFQSLLRSINVPILFVADEAHNLGAETFLDHLPQQANFRLALTATPDRLNDADGTQKLFEYFGEPVINFPIGQAIDQDFLCPYDYEPHVCQMTEEEYEKYGDLGKKLLEIRKHEGSTGKKSADINRIEGERVDLITGMENKLSMLKDLINEQKKNGDMKYTLVYCGSRKGKDGKRHIDRTNSMLGNELKIHTHTFTAQENKDLREQLLRRFADGTIQVLTAIKCLDEGVDVPATRVAYILASTRNPREYIQRRGRVLRKAKGKDKAIIHDFLAVPPKGTVDDYQIVEREIVRAREFAKIAMNKDEVASLIDELEQDYYE